jgi:hypothetical protein
MATADPVVEADYRSHVETYHAFVRGIRLSVATAVIVLASLNFFLM